MEFYADWKTYYWSSLFRVSIPNGMEFYWSLILGRLFRLRFQFPTGWNSTIYADSSRSNGTVSIPNGMEFYIDTEIRCKKKKGVSIPNGMEFYLRAA